MSVAVSGRVIWIKAIRDREGIAFQLAQLGRQHPLGRCRNQPPELTSRRRTAKWVVRPRQCMSAASMPWKASLNLRPSNSPTPAFGSTSLALVRSTGAGCLYAVFMARPAIQRRLNAAVVIFTPMANSYDMDNCTAHARALRLSRLRLDQAREVLTRSEKQPQTNGGEP